MSKQLPEKLQNYLLEQIMEGARVVCHSSVEEDALTWIVEPKDLPNWVVLVQWYPENESFSLINISHTTLKNLKQIIQDK